MPMPMPRRPRRPPTMHLCRVAHPHLLPPHARRRRRAPASTTTGRAATTSGPSRIPRSSHAAHGDCLLLEASAARPPSVLLLPPHGMGARRGGRVQPRTRRRCWRARGRRARGGRRRRPQLRGSRRGGVGERAGGGPSSLLRGTPERRISGDAAALRHGRLRWAGRARTRTHGTGEGRRAPSSDGFCL